MEEVAGFSAAQRRWFLQRDNYRCSFFYKIQLENGEYAWVRCNEIANLQVHHIVPRGWARHNLSHDFEVNGKNNGITLCSKHHIGKYMGIGFMECVHTDNEMTRLKYAEGNKKAYAEMMLERHQKVLIGLPYWNTSYDWQFVLTVQKRNLSFIAPYPTNKSRLPNGRKR